MSNSYISFGNCDISSIFNTQLENYGLPIFEVVKTPMYKTRREDMNTFSIGDRVIVNADSGNKQIGTVVDINDIPFETIRNEIKSSYSYTIPVKADKHISDWNGLVDNFTPDMNYYDGFLISALTPAIELSKLPVPSSIGNGAINVNKKDYIMVINRLKNLGWQIGHNVENYFSVFFKEEEVFLLYGFEEMCKDRIYSEKSDTSDYIEYKEIWIDNISAAAYIDPNKCLCNGPSKEVAIGLGGAVETIKVCMVCKKEK